MVGEGWALIQLENQVPSRISHWAVPSLPAPLLHDIILCLRLRLRLRLSIFYSSSLLFQSPFRLLCSC